MHIYKVITCCLDKTCRFCGSVPNAIVIRTATGDNNLYCDNCGSFIKKASQSDIRYFHRARMSINEETPLKVIMRCVTSELTWNDIYD